jgi:DNA-binding NtrC family response regulator
VIGIFKGYDWPGNVRELENIIKRIAVMVDQSTIYASDLPSNMRYCIQSGPSGLKSLKEVEAEHIKRIIDHADGNKTKAASILGIDRKTLRTKMNEYGIE